MGKRRKERRGLHPSEILRKKRKKQNIKRNKSIRTAQRKLILQRKMPDDIMSEIKRLDRIEYQMGYLEAKSIDRRRILTNAHKEAIKRVKEENIRARKKGKEPPIIIKGMNKIFRSAAKKTEPKRLTHTELKRLTHIPDGDDEEDDDDDLDDDINGVVMKKKNEINYVYNGNDTKKCRSNPGSDGPDSDDQDFPNDLMDEMFSKDEQGSMMFDESIIQLTEEELKLKKEEEKKKKAKERKRKRKEKCEEDNSSCDDSDDDSDDEILDLPPGLAIPPGMELKKHPPPPPLPEGVPLINPLNPNYSSWNPSIPIPFGHPFMNSLHSQQIPAKIIRPVSLLNDKGHRQPLHSHIDPLDPTVKKSSDVDEHNLRPIQGPAMGPVLDSSHPVTSSQPVIRKTTSHSFIPTSLIVRNRSKPKPLMRRRLQKPKNSIGKDQQIKQKSNSAENGLKGHSNKEKKSSQDSQYPIGDASLEYENFMQEIDGLDVDVSSDNE